MTNWTVENLLHRPGSTDDMAKLESEWNDLAQRLHAPPFLRPGWIISWVAAFGGVLRIWTAHEGDRLVGVLPLLESPSALRAPSNSETPLFAQLAETPTIAQHLITSAVSQQPRRVDLWPVDRSDPGIRYLRQIAGSGQARLVERTVALSAYIDTDGEWDTYLGTLARKHRGEVSRRMRRLRERGEVAIDIRTDLAESQDLLKEALRLEASGWKARHGTAISSRPRTERFYRDIVRWAAEQRLLRLAFLRLDGKAIAFDLSLEVDGVHYLLKTGYDTGYKELSPGTLLRHEMIRRAFSSDVIRYEFLGTVMGTHNEWKRRWTSEARTLVRVQMFSRSAQGFATWFWFAHVAPVKEAAVELVGRAASQSVRNGMNHLLARFRKHRYR